MATAAAEATRVEAPALAAGQRVLLYPVHGEAAQEVKVEKAGTVVPVPAEVATMETEDPAAAAGAQQTLMAEADPVAAVSL